MTLRRRRIEQVIGALAAARPENAPLATLAGLLDVLAQRRWLRRERTVLVVATIAANAAAAARLLAPMEQPPAPAAWWAIIALSIAALLRVAWIRGRLRALSGRAAALTALLRWLVAHDCS
jgi:hypothetical protein